ncbi:MAG: 3-phosphoshikimate 1-carboxyvinyltransferase [Verrucomicrobiota bacterium]
MSHSGLPDQIELVPPAQPVAAKIAVPGSKSITNRALILAALGRGSLQLRGALWSEDTQVMVDSLQRLGFDLEVAVDPDEAANRLIRVTGQGGVIPKAGSEANPLELFVGNAGTAARFLAALACLGNGVYRLSGVSRMHERPQGALFDALRQLGYRIETPNNKLPAVIYGDGPHRRSCSVSIAESSQFASALLLSARLGQWEVQVTGQNADESPYVEMTRQLLTACPQQGGAFAIEPDASSGSYFVAADFLLRSMPPLPAGLVADADGGKKGGFQSSPVVTVRDWPTSAWQIDAAFPKYLPLPAELSRDRHLGDSIMTAIVLAPLADHPVRFTDLGRLRIQECERVLALRTELSKCGGQLSEDGNTLTVYPSPLHGAEIDTYEDHRMAMCFAILGLKVPGIKINNPGCVKKTFPNFFQKLAGAAPRGLDIRIMDPQSHRLLQGDDLFAA